MKTCSHCKEVKILDHFSKDKQEKDGLYNVCKKCYNLQQNNHDKTIDAIAWRKQYYAQPIQKEKNKKDNQRYLKTEKGKNIVRKIRKRHQLKKYGLDEDTYKGMLTEQDNKCAICRRETVLVIDHDHKSGKVRKLLCNPCNLGIGLLKEDIHILKNTLNYLTSESEFNEEYF